MAIKLDGDDCLKNSNPDDKINFGTGNNIPPTFTIEGWFKFENHSSSIPQYIISREKRYEANPSFSIGIENNHLFFEYSAYVDNEAKTAKAISYNNVIKDKWHFFAAVKNGSYISLYLDGVDATSKKLLKTNNSIGDHSLTIGCLTETKLVGGQVKTANKNFFTGQIDNLRISNVIRFHVNDPIPTSPLTKAYWKTQDLWNFDYQTGATTVYDEVYLNKINLFLLNNDNKTEFVPSTIPFQPSPPPSSFPTPPPPSPPPSPYYSQCFDICSSDINCLNEQRCMFVNDTKRCVNPSCPNEVDCLCQSSPPPSPYFPDMPRCQ